MFDLVVSFDKLIEVNIGVLKLYIFLQMTSMGMLIAMAIVYIKIFLLVFFFLSISMEYISKSIGIITQKVIFIPDDKVVKNADKYINLGLPLWI